MIQVRRNLLRRPEVGFASEGLALWLCTWGSGLSVLGLRGHLDPPLFYPEVGSGPENLATFSSYSLAQEHS